MFGLRAMKEIKKKLKRKSRRPLWSLGMLAAVFAAASAAGIGGAAAIRHAAFGVVETSLMAEREAIPVPQDKPAAALPEDASPREVVLWALAGRKDDVEVILHRVYWCGQQTRLLGRLTATEAAGLLKAKRDWGAEFDSAGRLVLEETADDPLPSCRENAFIAMDREGNLALFDGPPRKDNVVRTFFQLDVKSLETGMSKERLRELAQGIRVADKDEYDSVLSVFSDYAYRKSEGVMKRHE